MSGNTPPKKPVRPRNAASLIVYEQRDGETYILMGKRAKGHRFLPDVYVFPGGRVDDSDFSVIPQTPLNPEVAEKLSMPGDLSHALATAAVRETYEETGLVIGQVVHGQLVPDLANLDYIVRAITPTISPIRFNTRFLMVDAQHTKGSLGGSGELVDLRWVSLDQAFKMPIVDITEFVLQEVRLRLSGKSVHETEFPLFTYFKGKPFIRRG